MTSNIEYKNYTVDDQAQLFMAFAEALRLPLLQIARSAELSRMTNNVEALQPVATAADMLNRLINTYLLSLRAQAARGAEGLVPVSVSAVLHEVAQTLQPLAQTYACDLELSLAGKYGPVLAEPVGLQAALVSMGQALLIAGDEQTPKKRRVITLAAHRTGQGITAGMFSDLRGLDTASLRRAQALKGQAGQPLNQLTSGSGAGIFIASSLLSTMSGGLRVARYQKRNGLAATFTPSPQLALV